MMWLSNMRSFLLFCAIAALLLDIYCSRTRADEGSPTAGAAWQSQLTIGPAGAQQQQALALLRGRPLTDNGVIVPWLRDNITHLQPHFAFELSRRLFADD